MQSFYGQTNKRGIEKKSKTKQTEQKNSAFYVLYNIDKKETL